ncbi:hypothetical protein [Fimbriimonas ginsengisoli]|uniref:Uncharacterized protein n=1 Tax=Fimbriimonas ginsengisoli Gsoil 348 TaxID=661478 RepID=A0A068NKK7_FIMGI|nr:hypothetical protein [Fimbriimonas ginsengisoli]AIE83972.1 hypothetical protein OP10G_0604 [Fimbriimonas ginsengisoli Gsoil 348]
MWIFLRDSFLSIVQHEHEPRLLQVRGRIRGDIERVFPEAFVAEDGRSDYRFCANLSRERVAQAIALRLNHIDYESLNENVHGTDRGVVYDQAYSIMLEEQVRRYGSELDLPTYIPHYDLQEPVGELTEVVSSLEG